MRQPANPLPEPCFQSRCGAPAKACFYGVNIAGSSLVSRSKKHCAFCAVISAAVAHLVERHLAKVEVASSSLVSRSKKKTPVYDRCFLFGIRGNLTTFGRQSRPKVDAATRPRLASARRRVAVTYAAPVGRSLTKSVLDGRIWCLWTGCRFARRAPCPIKKRAHPRCARCFISDQQ